MPGLSISINARQRSIIYSLLSSEGHLTLAMLSKMTSLTPRIIRYNLDTVRAWFRNEGVLVRSRPGFGIELEVNRQNRKRLISIIENYTDGNLVLTRPQRQRLSLFVLLNSDTPITYNNLASNEGISRSTVVHDINDMQRWLNSYNAQLKRSPNKGAFVVCSELSRRFAVLNIIREELGDKKWYDLWHVPRLTELIDKSMPIHLGRFIKTLPFDFCRELVGHIENMVGHKMALYSRIEVMVFLALTINALSRGLYHTEEVEFDRDNRIEIDIARVVFTNVSRKFGLIVPENECGLLAMSIVGAKWEDTRVSLVEKKPIGESEDHHGLIVRYVAEILTICARQLHPLLHLDDELHAELARHLEPVLYRLQYKLPILNECLDEILENYPEVFRTARLSVAKIEAELGLVFPHEEVAYIAMYLVAALNRLKTKDRSKHNVVLLGDGVRAKTSLLRAQLEYEFSSFEIIGVLNGNIPGEAVLDQAELVISLIPGEVEGIPTIQVSPFLRPAEKKQLQNWLNTIEDKTRRSLVSTPQKPDLVNLLAPKHIVINNMEMDWREAVKKASRPLLDSDLIKPLYVNAMIGLVEQYGPYMLLAPGVVILHARPVDGVNGLCLSMLLLKQPVAFGDANTEMVDIAFVLGAIDEHSHLNALFQLSNLIGQEDFREVLRRSSSSSDVIRSLWTFSFQSGENPEN